MNKIIFLVVLSLLVVLVDLGLVVLNFGNLYLSILIATVFLVTVFYDFELALIFALCTGFLFDTSLMSRNLFMTPFLAFEVIAIGFIQRKIVDFVNPIIFVILIFAFEILRIVLSLIFFPNRISLIGIFSILGGNLIVALIFTFVWWAFVFSKTRQI